MKTKTPSRHRRHELGQTILLVAISLVGLLGMAALAIDVVTLYVARSEIQRAADAAALAGAKAIADSSITTLLLTDPNFTTVQGWVPTAATARINVVLQNNLVAGTVPTLSSATVDWSRQGNPHITVVLNRPNLPTFFSKIWGASPANATATATAEAYNPANLTTITPISPKSVKPWLVANADPVNVGKQFVNISTWVVDSAAIGETFDIISNCSGVTSSCSPLLNNPPQVPSWSSSSTNPQVEYVPAVVTANPANVCPTSVGSCNSSCLGADSYELSVECADVDPYAYVNCGGGSTTINWDNGVNPGGLSGDSANGAQCLIHASGAGFNTQDTLDAGPWPGAPMQITGGSCSINSGVSVANSSSIATIPIIDNTSALNLAGGPVTVVGFLQAFINLVVTGGGQPLPPPGSINITVLNVVGCSSANNGNPSVVGGAGTSPIPVRLITPP